MKNLFALMLAILALAMVFSSDAKAGTCSSISRTNFSPNTVLTSSELNNQFNTVYGAANALDGGCVTDGTLELGAADSTWNPVKDYIFSGCKVTYSDASTIAISRCYLGVNGNIVQKSTSSTVAFGCTNCSSETSGTVYYIYVANGSTGSTLTPLILTTAPNEDGYDASNNRVIGRFYNNDNGDIDQYSLDHWVNNRFQQVYKDQFNVTVTYQGIGAASTASSRARRVGKFIHGFVKFSTGTPTADVFKVDFGDLYEADAGYGSTIFSGECKRGAAATEAISVLVTGGDDFFQIGYQNGATNQIFSASNGNTVWGAGQNGQCWYMFPVTGWGGD